MSAEEKVELIIDQALLVAAEKADEATDYSDKAISASSGSISMPYAPIAFTAKNIEPPVHIPFNATGLDSALYDSTYNRIITDLSDKFAAFFAQYFPDECNYLAAAQDWMCKVLTEGGSGIKPHIEDQIWQRDRSRTLSEVSRASEEVIATFAARGFPLPPGAMLHQLNSAQRQAQDQIAQGSRDRAIQVAQLEIENIRFCVQQALEYRVRGIQAAGDYIKVLAIGPEIAMRLATAAADAQARLITAANTYYGSRIRLEELRLNVLQYNETLRHETAKVDVREFSERLKARVTTLAAAAEASGNMAAAALNAVHASAAIAVQGETT